MSFGGKSIIKRNHNSFFYRKVVLQTPKIFRETARRISPAASRQKGSATVETALALPLFLLTVLMLLSPVDMMRTYIQTQEKLYEQTKQAAVYGGAAGNFTISASKKDCVEFYKIYRISPAVRGPGFQSFLTANHCVAHIWNGYDNSGVFETEDDPAYVYVTESGTVYHRRRSCKHLNVTIMEISPTELSTARSEDGSIYRPCPDCAKGMSQNELAGNVLYIAPYGIKYHLRITCSDLKRTVFVVPFAQVKGKRPCSECGG